MPGEITLVGLGHLLVASGLSVHAVLHKERPVSAVLWLAVLWAFPYVGALVYLSFGVDRVRSRADERRASRQRVERRLEKHPLFTRLTAGETDFEDLPGAHIFRATDPAVRPNRVLRGNHATLLVDGESFYPALFAAVEGARHSVHLQTYIYSRGRTGRRLRDLLAARAREGVEVRLLYDRFGSSVAHLSGFFDPARRAGVRVRSISQANPLKGQFQINLRNHRKLAVVDGRSGFVGGINIDDRNVGGSDGSPPDRDYHVRLEGPAVADLQYQFVDDWHFASGAPPDRLLGDEYFPEISEAGGAAVQVVPGGPELEGRGLADAFFAAMVAARRTLDIVTAYFVPDEPILQALRYAAVRGVRVRVVLPARSNHWYAGFAARALYGPLLEAGVRIYERGQPFLHAKALVADGVYALLGSANLDYRSLHLNFELNVEVADREFVPRVLEQVEREIAASREVTAAAYRGRPLPRKLAENFCRLFQPVL